MVSGWWRGEGWVLRVTYNLRRGRQSPGCSSRLRDCSRRGCCRLRIRISRRCMSRPPGSNPQARAPCRSPPCIFRPPRSSCWGTRSRSSWLSHPGMPNGASRARRGLTRPGERGSLLVMCSRLGTLGRRVGQTVGGEAVLPVRWPIFCEHRLRCERHELLLLHVVDVMLGQRLGGLRRRSIRGGTWRLGRGASCEQPWVRGAVSQLEPAHGPAPSGEAIVKAAESASCSSVFGLSSDCPTRAQFVVGRSENWQKSGVLDRRRVIYYRIMLINWILPVLVSSLRLSGASCRVQKVRVVALLTFGCTDDDGWIKIIAKHGGPLTP